MVNIHFLLFYCILRCAPEQREQIRAITIKSGRAARRSNTRMMRILMRHLPQTPPHPRSSAAACHPEGGISCLQKAHCTVFTASLRPTFDFTVRAGFKQQLPGGDGPAAPAPPRPGALSAELWGAGAGARGREGRGVSGSLPLEEGSLAQKGPLINFKHWLAVVA